MRQSPARATTRSLLAALALCAAMAIAIAPSAPALASPRSAAFKGAHPRLTRQAFVWRALSMIRSRTATRSIASAEPIPETFQTVGVFHVKSHDANFPDWFVGALRTSDATYVAFATSLVGSDAYEQYEWIKEVPGADLSVGSRLLFLGIHTGNDLGAFGRIDMTFTSTHRGDHRYHCGSTGKLLEIDHVAQGSFSGTMTLDPGLPGLPAVLHATHPHGQAVRMVSTGATCPQPHFPHRCYTSRSFMVRSPDGGALRIDPRYGFGSVETTTVVDGFTEYRSVFVFPGSGGSGGEPVTLTRAGFTIDGDAIGGVFSGSIVFDRSAPAVIHVSRCKKVTTPFVWRSGSLDVGFATGTDSFTGAHLDAWLRWLGRAT